MSNFWIYVKDSVQLLNSNINSVLHRGFLVLAIVIKVLCKKSQVFPEHAMKAYRWNKNTVPLFLNLGNRCKCMVNFMPWLL
jgi:hypothetical protein